jgi:hypothetical protein
VFLPGKPVFKQRWTSNDFNWRMPNKMFSGHPLKKTVANGLQESYWQKKRGYLPQ